ESIYELEVNRHSAGLSVERARRKGEEWLSGSYLNPSEDLRPMAHFGILSGLSPRAQGSRLLSGTDSKEVSGFDSRDFFLPFILESVLDSKGKPVNLDDGFLPAVRRAVFPSRD